MVFQRSESDRTSHSIRGLDFVLNPTYKYIFSQISSIPEVDLRVREAVTGAE